MMPEHNNNNTLHIQTRLTVAPPVTGCCSAGSGAGVGAGTGAGTWAGTWARAWGWWGRMLLSRRGSFYEFLK